MATTGVDQITNGMANVEVNGENNSHEASQSTFDRESIEKWGLPLQEVYKIALKFFKEKEGKALQLTYQTKLRLVALTKQAAFGTFRPDLLPDVGFLDVVGNDRKQAWQSLGTMSKEEAMAELVRKMTESCSLFTPYVEAHKAEKNEANNKQEEEGNDVHQDAADDAAHKVLEAQQQKQQEQELQIRQALNQQTAVQFRQYAEQQYPDNKEMQDELIRQLQDQHFQQYMQQVYQQQQLLQQQHQQSQQLQKQVEQQQQQQQQPSPQTQPTQAAPAQVAGEPKPSGSATVPVTNLTPNGDATPGSKVVLASATTTDSSTDAGNNNSSPIPDGVTPIPPAGDDEEEYNLAAASMWTRKDLKDFKDSLRKDKESVIKIGSAETVTVRVPTHEDGTCLFWEFATDYYDIGFGVYFEWSVSPTNTVSVHISESSDEEDETEEETKAAEAKGGDVEKGSSSKKDNRPPTDEIIPVYRRDCHEEVYCGSHTYPGQGVYLLKFDNSYSLWRSKTLYYRVYYSR